MTNNFLPYAESVKLKDAGIVIDSEFCYYGEGRLKTKYAKIISEQSNLGTKLVPAPTATEMLAVMPKHIKPKRTCKSCVVGCEAWLAIDIVETSLNYLTYNHCSQDCCSQVDIVFDKNLLIALSYMLKWLKQERYI